MLWRIVSMGTVGGYNYFLEITIGYMSEFTNSSVSCLRNEFLKTWEKGIEIRPKSPEGVQMQLCLQLRFHKDSIQMIYMLWTIAWKSNPIAVTQQSSKANWESHSKKWRGGEDDEIEIAEKHSPLIPYRWECSQG